MAEFIVGVTGGIGSGKTLVTDAFAAKGVVIADADEAARHIVEPGQPALAQIVAHFGEGDHRFKRTARSTQVARDCIQ